MKQLDAAEIVLLGATMPCPTCKGTGEFVRRRLEPDEKTLPVTECKRCGGSGNALRPGFEEACQKLGIARKKAALPPKKVAAMQSPSRNALWTQARTQRPEQWRRQKS